MYAMNVPLPRQLAYQGDITGLLDIVEKGHGEVLSPLKPVDMTPALWQLLQRCWKLNPSERQSMSEIVEELEHM